jgi:hypothetical protein
MDRDWSGSLNKQCGGVANCRRRYQQSTVEKVKMRAAQIHMSAPVDIFWAFMLGATLIRPRN